MVDTVLLTKWIQLRTEHSEQTLMEHVEKAAHQIIASRRTGKPCVFSIVNLDTLLRKEFLLILKPWQPIIEQGFMYLNLD